MLDLGILPGDIPRRGPSQRYSNAIKALEEAQENAKLGQPTVPPTTHGGKAKRASSRRRKQQHRRSRQHGRPPEAAPTKDSPPTEASRPATETSGEQATSSCMERGNDDARMNNVDGRPSNLNTGHVHDIRGTAFDFAPRVQILLTDKSLTLKLGIQLKAFLSQSSRNQIPRVVAY